MVLPSPFSPTNQNNLSVNSIRATLGAIQPVQRHLKFSHVVGQVSAKSSNTTRPTTENMQSAYKLMTYCFVQQLPDVPLMDICRRNTSEEKALPETEQINNLGRGLNGSLKVRACALMVIYECGYISRCIAIFEIHLNFCGCQGFQECLHVG